SFGSHVIERLLKNGARQRPQLAKRLANLYSPLLSMDSSPQVLIALGFIWYVTFLFSTTCHEATHALAAKIGGDETAALGGQVSLNPVPHMRREPWGMIVIPILSFLMMHGNGMMGWASAPYDPLWERRHPRRSGWMALAGPTANFLLMLISVGGLRLGGGEGGVRPDPVPGH